MAKGRIPFAKWQPISGRSRMSNRPRRVTVHIAVTDAPDIYGPGKGPGGTYAHCYNPVSGSLLQHQELHRRTYADLGGNGSTISVEHQGRPGDRMSANQIDNLARLFAHAVTEYGVPNRIATWNDTSGLAWHRLGCKGNFGAFSKSDRTTWSGSQTGQRWSNAYGKTCPTDKFINQLDEVFDRAQSYIKGEKPTGGGSPVPSKPKPSKPSKSKKSYEWPGKRLRVDGDWGPITRRAYQRLLAGIDQYDGRIDGQIGPLTVKAEQRWLRGLGYYDGWIDGDRGPMTIKALQAKLYDDGHYRNGRYSKAVMVDGSFGKRTVKGAQRYLNSQRKYYR